MHLQRRTEKLYYKDVYLARSVGTVTKVTDEIIELDATLAYPEGGGQESDTGSIEIGGVGRLRFVKAQRMYAHACEIAGMGEVRVGGVIWHEIDPADKSILSSVAPGARATITIDIERRARLSLSHSASHVLYLAVGCHRPDAIGATLGCHIREYGARFDFAVKTRFSPEEIAAIEATANAMVERDAAITTSASEQEPDARNWVCEGHAIPCGGTHIERTGLIGRLTIQRRGLGAGKERIACVFPNARIEPDRYHMRA